MLEPNIATDALQSGKNQCVECLISILSARIRGELGLPEILQVAVNGLRLLLKCDRVVVYQFQPSQNGIYQFQPSQNGIVVAESHSAQAISLINQQIVDNCFHNENLKNFLCGKTSAIDDIYAAGLNHCYLKFLERFSVQSVLVVPILIRDRKDAITPYFQGFVDDQTNPDQCLWGLLIAHQCDAPRHWQSEDLELLDMVTDQVAISIQQMLSQKQSESTLLDRDERFRQLAENIQQVFYLTDIHNAEVLYISRNYEKVWGRSCQSLYDHPESYMQTVHPDDREIIINHYRQQQLGEERSAEYRIIRPDGEIRWILDSAFPIRNQNGDVYRISGIADDITDRKNIELALNQLNQSLELKIAERTFELIQLNQELESRVLRRTAELQKALEVIQDLNQNLEIKVGERTEELQNQLTMIEASSDGIAIINQQGAYIYVNPAYLKMFDYRDPCGLIGKNWRMFFDVEEIQRIEQEIFPCISENKSWYGESKPRRLDGSTFVQELSLTKAHNGMICVCRDATDWVLMEEGIRQALIKEKELNRLRSSFVEIASHEFRTPLTVISSSAAILKTYSDSLSEDRKKSHFDNIQSSVEQMVSLIDDVLMIDRAETNKLRFNPELTELVSFCRNIAEELQLNTKTHQIIFDAWQNDLTNQTLTTLEVQCDRKLLRQILNNLLSNAIKYSPQGGPIHFDLFTEANNLVLKVQDQGIGIPSDAKTQLFDSFYRAKNVGTIAGTGLGLAIVKKCVVAHQGIISEDSQEGAGATFTVTIPIIKEDYFKA